MQASQVLANENRGRTCFIVQSLCTLLPKNRPLYQQRHGERDKERTQSNSIENVAETNTKGRATRYNLKFSFRITWRGNIYPGSLQRIKYRVRKYSFHRELQLRTIEKLPSARNFHKLRSQRSPPRFAISRKFKWLNGQARGLAGCI